MHVFALNPSSATLFFLLFPLLFRRKNELEPNIIMACELAFCGIWLFASRDVKWRPSLDPSAFQPALYAQKSYGAEINGEVCSQGNDFLSLHNNKCMWKVSRWSNVKLHLYSHAHLASSFGVFSQL